MGVVSALWAYMESDNQKNEERRERKKQREEDAAAIAEEEAKTLKKRKATINKQRKQLLPADGASNLTKTSSTGVASANILQREALG